MSTKPYVVVAGTDYSAPALRALRAAYQQALQRSPAALHVAHISVAPNPEPTLSMPGMPGLAALPVPSLHEQQTALNQYLDEQLATSPGFSGSGVKVFGHVLIDTPSFGLTRLASELEADLLVVGSHGVHGIARWLLGSVAEGVVRHAECPVLVVPPEPGKLAVPAIEPPCPECVATRRQSSSNELWCERHRERHGRRHSYYQTDRVATETNLPLILR